MPTTATSLKQKHQCEVSPFDWAHFENRQPFKNHYLGYLSNWEICWVCATSGLEQFRFSCQIKAGRLLKLSSCALISNYPEIIARLEPHHANFCTFSSSSSVGFNELFGVSRVALFWTSPRQAFNRFAGFFVEKPTLNIFHFAFHQNNFFGNEPFAF